MKRERGIAQSIYIYPAQLSTLTKLSDNTSEAIRTCIECVGWLQDKYPEILEDALVSTGNKHEETVK